VEKFKTVRIPGRINSHHWPSVDAHIYPPLPPPYSHLLLGLSSILGSISMVHIKIYLNNYCFCYSPMKIINWFVPSLNLLSFFQIWLLSDCLQKIPFRRKWALKIKLVKEKVFKATKKITSEPNNILSKSSPCIRRLLCLNDKAITFTSF
jgi:hypothetical protein